MSDWIERSMPEVTLIAFECFCLGVLISRTLGISSSLSDGGETIISFDPPSN